jgi:hypothetical protein
MRVILFYLFNGLLVSNMFVPEGGFVAWPIWVFTFLGSCLHWLKVLIFHMAMDQIIYKGAKPDSKYRTISKFPPLELHSLHAI